MKLSLIAVLAFSIFFSCNSPHNKTKSTANELIYSASDTTAGYLSAGVSLAANIKTGEVTAQIKLSNSGSAPVNIQNLDISTPEGIRSLPTAGFAPFLLARGKDTTIAVKFNPINDLKLYQATGLNGSFKPGYTISLDYKVPGSDNMISLASKPVADKTDFIDYEKKDKKPITGYSFNTKAGFNERETKYLAGLMPAGKPAFVYLSEHEIAVAGLNFRLKTYAQHDTIYSELLVINHADFPVKFMPDSLTITASSQKILGAIGIIKFEKISGSQSDANMMEKGDRLLIHYKKHIKTVATPASLVLHLKSSFVLSGPKNLFGEDIELVPLQF